MYKWAHLNYLSYILTFQAELTFRPPRDTVPPTLAFTIAALQSSYLDLSLRLTKVDQQGCPSSSFSVRLAPCLLLLPHCSWGSHSLATASLVPQAPYRRRAPASPSGAPLSPRDQPLPTIPPQVCFIYFFILMFLCTVNYYFFFS